MGTIKFGTDGWRGVIADDFTFPNVRTVACAIARYVVRAEKPNAGMLIGYDTRYGSERFARAAAEVVSMTGMPVWVAEKACPSPALSLLVRQRRAAGGIMITASHNPYRWNGVKFKASYGSSALPSIVAQIEKELVTVLAEGVPPLPARPDCIQPLDILSDYLDTVDKLVDWDRIREANFRFVVDPMHGAARGLRFERIETLTQTLLAAGEGDQFDAALRSGGAEQEERRRLQLKTLLVSLGETFRVLWQRREA